MRSEEFAAGSGSRFHPNVRHLPSDAPGGIGSVNGSVVGMVPTHVLAQYRHHQADVNVDSHETVNKIRADLRAGIGIQEPVMLEYNHHEGWAYLGEGNHRLRAAELEGVPETPVYVKRSARSDLRWIKNEEQRGGPASHSPEAELSGGHVPGTFHPDYLRLGESHEARDLGTEIADLLQPAGRWR